jgi:hypothetical protein
MSVFHTLLTYFAAGQTPSTSISISKSDLGLDGGPTDVTGSQVSALLTQAYIAAGVVAVIVIIVGGIRYATANGDSSQITAAKNMIMYAVVGLIVIISAAGLTQFVLTNVAK